MNDMRKSGVYYFPSRHFLYSFVNGIERVDGKILHQYLLEYLRKEKSEREQSIRGERK
jgi:hypothetical protein